MSSRRARCVSGGTTVPTPRPAGGPTRLARPPRASPRPTLPNSRGTGGPSCSASCERHDLDPCDLLAATHSRVEEVGHCRCIVTVGERPCRLIARGDSSIEYDDGDTGHLSRTLGLHPPSGYPSCEGRDLRPRAGARGGRSHVRRPDAFPPQHAPSCLSRCAHAPRLGHYGGSEATPRAREEGDLLAGCPWGTRGAACDGERLRRRSPHSWWWCILLTLSCGPASKARARVPTGYRHRSLHITLRRLPLRRRNAVVLDSRPLRDGRQGGFHPHRRLRRRPRAVTGVPTLDRLPDTLQL